jgi:hypothetical protein
MDESAAGSGDSTGDSSAADDVQNSELKKETLDRAEEEE